MPVKDGYHRRSRRRSRKTRPKIPDLARNGSAAVPVTLEEALSGYVNNILAKVGADDDRAHRFTITLKRGITEL